MNIENTMNSKTNANTVSVVVPVGERSENVVELYDEYKRSLKDLSNDIEFIYVVSSTYPDETNKLRALSQENDDVKLVVLSRNFGEATAIQVGFEHAAGELILTLPAYEQVKTDGIIKLFDHIEDHDIVLAKRWPRIDSGINKMQTRLFNFALSLLSEQHYSDIGCGVRLIKRRVLEEIHMYGDQHRFLPLLAYQVGFTFTEIEIPQAASEARSRIYKPGIYIRRILDLITIIFLTKFNKKPLRFFGLIGASAIITGILGLVYLAYERLFMDIAVSDRPLLVLFTLFFILGVQLIAIGLVGETLIFTQAKANKEYRIKEIIE